MAHASQECGGSRIDDVGNTAGEHETRSHGLVLGRPAVAGSPPLLTGLFASTTMVSRYQIASAPSPDGGRILELQRRDWEVEAARADGQLRWEVARSYALPGPIVSEGEALAQPVMFLRIKAEPCFEVALEEPPPGLATHRAPACVDQLHRLLQQALIEAASSAATAGRPAGKLEGLAAGRSFVLAVVEPLSLHADWERHGAGFRRFLADRGWSYGDVAELCEICGRPRPSSMHRGELRDLRRWLEGDTRAVDAWLTRRGVLLDGVVAGALCSVHLHRSPDIDAEPGATSMLVVESYLPWLDTRALASLARLLPDPDLAAHVGPVTCLVELPTEWGVGGVTPSSEQVLSALTPRLLVGARQGVTRRSFRGPIKPLQAYLNLTLHPVAGNLADELSVWLGSGKGRGRLHLWKAAQDACAALGVDSVRAADLCYDLLREVVATWARPWSRGRVRAHFACSLRLRLYNELERLPRKTNLRLFGRLVQHGFAERYLALQAEHGPWAIPPTAATLLGQLRRVAAAQIDAVFAASGDWAGIPDADKQAILDELQQRMGQRWSKLLPATPREAHLSVQRALSANAALDDWSERLLERCPERRPWDERLEAMSLFDVRDWEAGCPGLLPGFQEDFLAAVRHALHTALGHQSQPGSWPERYTPTGRDRLMAMAEDVAGELLVWIGPKLAASTTAFLVDSWLSVDALDEACSRGGHAYRIPGGVMDAHRARFWPSSVELYLARLAHGHSAAVAAQACGLPSPDAFLQAANAWGLGDLLSADVLADPAAPLRSYTDVLHRHDPATLAAALLEGASTDPLLAGVLDWDLPSSPAALAVVGEPDVGGDERDVCWLTEGKAMRHDVVVVQRQGRRLGPLRVTAVARLGREIAQATSRGGKGFALQLEGMVAQGMCDDTEPIVLCPGDVVELRRPSLEEHLQALFRDIGGFGSLSEGERLELGRLLGRTRWKVARAQQVTLMDGDGAVDHDTGGDDGAQDGDGVAVSRIIGRLNQADEAQRGPRRDP